MILILFLLVWVILGIKAGAYRMAIHLFSLVVAVYAAVMSTPFLLQSGPKLLPDLITALVCLAAVGGLVFIALDYFLFRFFVRGADTYFRPLVKMAAGTVFGLLFGYILWGCLLMVYCMTPISRWESAEKFMPRQSARDFASVSIGRVCQTISSMSLDYPEIDPRDIASTLMELE
ncbi:MAG: hypothetical protein ABFD91_04780 [Anaerohalosphaeraceae bacterium]